MNPPDIIGWDVGGAHLKAARVDGGGTLQRVLQLPCPLWQGMDRLQAALDQALADLGGAADHAITMTGEMADLFADRDAGVRALVDALASRLGLGARLHFYAGDAGFLTAGEAIAAAQRVASANWHASAAFAARRGSDALLLDVGSTTTDIVLVAGGTVCARAWGDAQRLAAEELLYTGVTRTPVMALARRAPFDGRWVPLMAEHFATTADVHRLAAALPPEADQHPAADGGDKTIAGSARRLARMLGRDAASAGEGDWRRLAAWFAQRQLALIGEACARALSRGVLQDDAPLLGAGIGRFLVMQLASQLGRPYRDFAALLPGAAAAADRGAVCAPAAAVACLLHGRMR
jgi:probable H4MPT-linked C1 transfer pathway protein